MTAPWVAVEATVRRNGKLMGLPSDTARWGWLVMLGEAKLLRQSGTFSPGQWTELMGRYARFRADYLTAGLVHVAPVYCEAEARCLKGRGPFPDGRLVIHDWLIHQREHAQRTADWRDRQSDTPGDVVSDVPGDVSSDIPSRALSPVSVKEETGVGGPGEGERLQALAEELTGIPFVLQNLYSGLGEKALRQVAKHGWAAVEKAWRTVARAAGPFPELGQIVLGADNALNPVPGKADLKAVTVGDDVEREREAFDRGVRETRERNRKLWGDQYPKDAA